MKLQNFQSYHKKYSCVVPVSALLVGMLSKEESFFTSELSTGKAQREMTRLRNKAK